MATSSSNKMPLLIDRPLHSFATLGGAAALTTATNLNTPSGGGCVLLVDCLSNDGAVVDSISIIANQASTTAVRVCVFLSIAASAASITSSNTVCVASEVVTSTTIGDRTNIALPPLCIPVPNLGGSTSATETAKKNTGLYVPPGAVIYVGTSAAITAPSTSSRIHVFAQGGFF